jgi:hypothetical protein
MNAKRITTDLKAENRALRAEKRALNVEIETLKAENLCLKSENATYKRELRKCYVPDVRPRLRSAKQRAGGEDGIERARR